MTQLELTVLASGSSSIANVGCRDSLGQPIAQNGCPAVNMQGRCLYNENCPEGGPSSCWGHKKYLADLEIVKRYADSLTRKLESTFSYTT